MAAPSESRNNYLFPQKDTRLKADSASRPNTFFTRISGQFPDLPSKRLNQARKQVHKWHPVQGSQQVSTGSAVHRPLSGSPPFIFLFVRTRVRQKPRALHSDNQQQLKNQKNPMNNETTPNLYTSKDQLVSIRILDQPQHWANS